MNKNKDNNHYISRFQLRRFLSVPPPDRPGKYYTWVYESSGAAFQENIRVAGSEHQFYGSDSDDLENLFSDKESKYGSIYADIITDPSRVSKHKDELSDLFWVFGFRTRAIRERIRSSAIATMGQAANSVDSDVAKNFFEREALRRVNEEIDARLGKMNVFERIALKKTSKFQKELRLIPLKVRKLVANGSVGTVIRNGFLEVTSAVSYTKMLDEGHNNGLREFIAEGGRCPEKFRPLKWEVVASEQNEFVLGDSGPFALTETLKEEPFVGVGEKLLEAYLPISPQLCLAALFKSSAPHLTSSQIRKCTISTSLENFFSHAEDDELKSLAKTTLGNATEIIPADEIDEIIRKLWDRK